MILGGCKSGLLAGVVFALLQLGFVAPLVHRAEVFESAPAQQQEHHHDHRRDNHEHGGVHSHGHQYSHQHGHSHQVIEAEKWERPFLTFVGAVLLGVSFGILSSLILFSMLRFKLISSKNIVRQPWWAGLAVGIVGFAIFHGLPALGLRPALPGVIGSEEDHSVRQIWWFVSVASSISAFVLFVCFFEKVKEKGFLSQALLFSAILALLLFPFFGYGVPVYSTASVTPLDLQQRFILVSLVVSAAFWLVLGTMQTYFVRKNMPGPAGMIE